MFVSTASGALGVVPFSDIVRMYVCSSIPEIGLCVLSCSTEKGKSVQLSPESYQWVIRELSVGYQRAISGLSVGYQRVISGL